MNPVSLKIKFWFQLVGLPDDELRANHLDTLLDLARDVDLLEILKTELREIETEESLKKT